MKIIHIVMSDSFAGIEQHVNELACNQKNEFDIKIIVSSGISKKFNSGLELIEIENFGRRSIYQILKLAYLCLLYTSPSPRD